jgi:hypothetical protein
MKIYVHFWYTVHLFLEWEVFRKKLCRENQNTHFMFNNFYENHAVYERMWKNMGERDKP